MSGDNDTGVEVPESSDGVNRLFVIVVELGRHQPSPDFLGVEVRRDQGISSDQNSPVSEVIRRAPRCVARDMDDDRCAWCGESGTVIERF